MGQVTISGNTFDVYGDEAGAKAYFAGHINSADYDNATSNNRRKAHVSATRWIDRELWQGTISDATTPQPLAFPRDGLVDCQGNALPDDTTPDDIVNATYELMLILLGDSNAIKKASTFDNTKRLKAGSAEIEKFRPGDPSGGAGKTFPVEAQKLVQCYLASATKSNGVAYGDSQTSQFDDCDGLNRTQGYY